MFQIILRKALTAISISQGRRKSKAYAKNSDGLPSKLGNATAKNQTQRKKTKKRFSLADKLRSLTKSKEKKPIATGTEQSINSGTPNPIFEKTPQNNAVPEHIKVLNELNANLDRMIKTSRTPYELPARNRRSIAAKRLMTTIVKQQQNAPLSYPDYTMPSLGNPFPGQNNTLFPQPMSAPNQYVPSSPVNLMTTNPFNLTLSSPEPTFEPMQIRPTPPALASASQPPISPFFQSPTTVPFTRNTAIPATPTLADPRNPFWHSLEGQITAVPLTANTTTLAPNEAIFTTANLDPELSPLQHKPKKKSKKHKRNKKKHKNLDDAYNAATTESARTPQETPTTNLPSPTSRHIENIGQPFNELLRSVEAPNMVPNINGMNTLPVRAPTARRRSVMSIPHSQNVGLMEMQMSTAFPAEAGVGTSGGNFLAGYSDMENVAESQFFSRVPKFSTPGSPPRSNPFGNLSTSSRPHPFPLSFDTNSSSLNGPPSQTNEFTNSIYDQTDHMARTISPARANQHRVLSAQNSNVTDPGMFTSANVPSLDAAPDRATPLSDAQNSGRIPGYSFWQ